MELPASNLSWHQNEIPNFKPTFVDVCRASWTFIFRTSLSYLKLRNTIDPIDCCPVSLLTTFIRFELFIKTLNSSLNLHVINALFYIREYSCKTLGDTISRFIFLVRTWQDPWGCSLLFRNNIDFFSAGWRTPEIWRILILLYFLSAIKVI